MNRLYILILILLQSVFLYAQRSGCGIVQGFALTKGDTALNLPPVLFSIFDKNEFDVKPIDTIPGKIGIALITPDENKLGRHVVISNIGMFFYNTSLDSIREFRIEKLENIYIRGIKNAKGGFYDNNYNDYFMIVAIETNNPNVFNYQVYDVNTTTLKFEMPLAIQPELIQFYDKSFYIVGKNNLQGYSIAGIDPKNEQILFQKDLGSLAENPKQLINNNNVLDLYSSPGHHSIALTGFNLSNQTFTEKILTGNTGTKVSDMLNNHFIFQPLNDFTPTKGDTILLYTWNPQMNKFQVYKYLGFKTQALDLSFGKTEWGWGTYEAQVGTKWNGGTNDSIVYFDYYQSPRYIKPLSGYVFQISSVTVCVGSVNDAQTNNQLNIFPNPNEGNFTVKLNENENFELLEISDLSGKLLYATKVFQNQFNINLKRGCYLVKVILKNGDFRITKMAVR